MATPLSEKLTKFAKKNKFGANMKDSKFGKISEYISTKAAIINLSISANPTWGVPVGKSIMLAGPTSSGKTQIALSTIKKAQEMGYTIVYWDSEFAAEESIFKAIQADLEDIIHMPMAELEQIKTAFMQMDQEIEEGDKVLHIFDSMGAWITSKTVEDAVNGKEVKDMSIPGSKKGLMTLINQACGKKHMGAIIINHTYANVGGFGASTTISGGGALYMPSVILEFLTKAKWKDNKGEQIGNIFTFIIKKSRLTRESQKEAFAMSNENGLSKYYGLLKYAIDGDYLIETKKGRSKAYQLKHQVDAVGEEEAEKFLENDLYTLYETEKVFGELIQNTDFTNYLNSKFAYGVKDIAPVNTANENIENLEEEPEVDLIEG